MLPTLLVSVCLLSRLARADVQFVLPSPGEHESFSDITVQWQESGVNAALTSLTSYEILLCAGGNDPTNYNQLASLMNSNDPPSPQTANFTVPTYIGDDLVDAYFLKMLSKASSGDTIINFSSRFSIDGMKGAFPLKVLKGLKTVSGTAGPATIINKPGSSSKPSAAPSPTSTSTGSTSPTTSLSTGVVAAIAVAGFLLLAGLAGITIFTIRRRRANRLAHEMLSKGADGSTLSASPPPRSHSDPSTKETYLSPQRARPATTGGHGSSLSVELTPSHSSVGKGHLRNRSTNKSISSAEFGLSGYKPKDSSPKPPDAVYQNANARTGGWGGIRAAATSRPGTASSRKEN